MGRVIPFSNFKASTRAEFLDFHRRLLLTENLLCVANGERPLRTSIRERAEIKTKMGLLRSREMRKPGTSSIFIDGDLKDIKKVFSAAPFSGHHGWLKVCEVILKGKLELAEKGLGLADAMVLNALQCSRFSFVVSTDFDVGYAVLADPQMKDAVMPDSIAKRYRDYHFGQIL